MKILFVAQNFQMGGIQRALINTIKEFEGDNRYIVEVFSFGKGPLMAEMPEQIPVYTGTIPLRLVSTPFSKVIAERNILRITVRILCMILVRITGQERFYRLLFKKQRKFGKYDIAISYFNDVQHQHFNRGTNQFTDEFIDAEIKMAWIHTDPEKADFKRNVILNTYRNFDRLVCVSEACRQKLIKLVPEYNMKTTVVYNFFPVKEIRDAAAGDDSSSKEIRIVSVGRIENAHKRFNLIPEVCRKLKDNSLSNFQWTVVGEGPDLISNIKLCEDFGVTELIKFIGEKQNPYTIMKSSDLFVLTSAFEGYPMVVCEALILGIPVITTSYAAAGEQVKNNYNGIITGTEPEDLYTALEYLLQNPDEVTRMKNNIQKDAFSNEIARKQFEMAAGSKL